MDECRKQKNRKEALNCKKKIDQNLHKSRNLSPHSSLHKHLLSSSSTRNSSSSLTLCIKPSYKISKTEYPSYSYLPFTLITPLNLNLLIPVNLDPEKPIPHAFASILNLVCTDYIKKPI